MIAEKISCFITCKSLFLFILVTIVPFSSSAHESRPVYIEISETKPGSYSVFLKTPGSLPAFNVPDFSVPGSCSGSGDKLTSTAPDSYVSKYRIKCEDSLSGKTVKIRFPVLNPSISKIIRLNFLSGQTHNKLLNPKEMSWEIPVRENRFGVAKEYTLLGMSHIWKGIDHLLFLLCLIVIAGSKRRILITVTGFTIAHSVTLVLSTLNVVKLPLPPVEASIALSVAFVASEIAGGRKNSLAYKYPVTVSTSFGLLHGFGFAAVLNRIGLPQTELPASLLFFNIGVEVGQILFIALVLILLTLLKSVSGGFEPALKQYDKPAAYLIGSAASFWTIQRIYSFWY